ncbi:MAG: metallophosphoesterase [Termitinemataceae bacterium]
MNTAILQSWFEASSVLQLLPGDQVLIISDFHIGNGSRTDDMVRNQNLVEDLLEYYYLPRNYYLVLNGDIEELQRYSLSQVTTYWSRLYKIFDAFYLRRHLYKLIGNHDEDLLYERSYPYPMLGSLRIDTPRIPVFVLHGHQTSKMYTRYNNLIQLGLRYLVKPLGIKNISSARSPRRRFFVEKQAYEYARAKKLITVIGHTHRPLFESLGRYDYIKFEIERLCREYPQTQDLETRQRIAQEVQNLRGELAKLKKSERRDSIKQSLYGDELPVPCLFNSGTAIGKKGITAIELDRESISLVYWFSEGKSKKFVQRGSYTIEALSGTEHYRTVLNTDTLEYVQAKIELLG